MSAIVLKDISVNFPIQGTQLHGSKASWFNKLTQRKEYYSALNEFSLTVREGDRVGLVGLNGAGKSTLLRVMGGIYTPSSGSVTVNGNVSSLFDLSTGFEMELNAIENIKVRLLLLGLNKDEIRDLTGEIVAFSELGDFIYQPIRTYSAGMFLRLAFSVSTCINPDILLADEIIGAGDHIFAQKAQQRLKRMMENGKTSVLATHSTELIYTYCDRVVWLNKGVVVMDGLVDEVMPLYLKAAL